MAEAPKFTPYIVALAFGEGGPVAANALIAPHETAAVAAFTAKFIQDTGTKEPLMGVVVVPLAPDFLRAALRAVEGTLATGGENVVALVADRSGHQSDDPQLPTARAEIGAYVAEQREIARAALSKVSFEVEGKGGPYDGSEWPHPPRDPDAA